MPKPRDFRTADFANWRKRQLLKKALADAGDLETILDLPCGDGRFWSVFRDVGVSSLVAAEVSKGMLDVATENRLSSDFPEKLILTSAFDFDLEDRSVDFAACIDFYQHLASTKDQEKLLSEFGRVSRGYLALSASIGSSTEKQFTQSGFNIEGFYDLWPVLSTWRLYLLRKQN
jgi:ubiquinone/menaquinone biosynthesis C-methylase UbiE